MHQHAERRGLNTEHAFPFAVKGNFSRIVWHVVTGAPVEHANQHREGSKIHLQGHARNRVFDQTNATGLLLGFQSGAALEGVISHPGERFHLHYVDSEFSVSGHVDDYQITAGAVLLIPRR
jgi:alpha-acetolactate decarboxylase